MDGGVSAKPVVAPLVAVPTNSRRLMVIPVPKEGGEPLDEQDKAAGMDETSSWDLRLIDLVTFFFLTLGLLLLFMLYWIPGMTGTVHHTHQWSPVQSLDSRLASWYG